MSSGASLISVCEIGREIINRFRDIGLSNFDSAFFIRGIETGRSSGGRSVFWTEFSFFKDGKILGVIFSGFKFSF